MITDLDKIRTTMHRSAVFSQDRAYRYTLWREWSVQEIALTVAHDVDPRPFDYVQFIGLNPSVADEERNDNTMVRCMDFAKRWGFGGMCMTNLFAWRDTKPKDMKRAVDPIGQNNDDWLETIASDAGLIVCCWGIHGPHRNRASEFLARPVFSERLQRANGSSLQAFGLTANGQPKHPLMLAHKAQLQPLAVLLQKGSSPNGK
jgi:hypothetical protein